LFANFCGLRDVPLVDQPPNYNLHHLRALLLPLHEAGGRGGGRGEGGGFSFAVRSFVFGVGTLLGGMRAGRRRGDGGGREKDREGGYRGGRRREGKDRERGAGGRRREKEGGSGGRRRKKKKYLEISGMVLSGISKI
jgi:hypothetical protein